MSLPALLSAALDFLERHDTPVVSVSTIILAIATVFLWFATRKLVKETARGSAQSLRAYVTLISGICKPMQIGAELRVDAGVELKNSGKTPGYDFSTWMKICVSDAKGAPPYDEPTPILDRTGTSIIGPEIQVHTGRACVINQATLDAILREEMAVFVWGGADYVDAFGKPRFFLFRCMMMGPLISNTFWPLKPHRLGYKAN